MSNETTVRKYLADKIHGHVVQIESHATSAGVPDTNYCLYNGVEGWIEIKFSTHKKKFKVRGTQKTWFRRRLRCGHKRLYFFLRHEFGDGGREQLLIHVNSKFLLEELFKNQNHNFWRTRAFQIWGTEIDEAELYKALGG